MFINKFHLLCDSFQSEVIMKSPVKNSDSFFSAFAAEVLAETKIEENKVPEYFDSDLHDDDFIMMAEIYGGDFQKVWKKTHKKWWV